MKKKVFGKNDKDNVDFLNVLLQIQPVQEQLISAMDPEFILSSYRQIKRNTPRKHVLAKKK